MDTQSLLERLSTLGLSETDARIYLLVLERGDVSVVSLAEETALSQRHLRERLETLAADGMLELDDRDSSTIVRAISPTTVVELLRDDLESLVSELERRRRVPSDETPAVTEYRDRETILDRLEKLVAAADDEVVCSLPGELYPELRSAFRSAYDRDVMVVLLLWGSDPDEFSIEQFDGVASVVRAERYWAPMSLVIDGNRAALASPQQLFFDDENGDRAFEMHDRLLGYITRAAIISYSWPGGREVYAEDPEPLPWTDDWFPEVTLQTALHRRVGTQLRVEFEGRPIDQELVSGVIRPPLETPFETFEGRIVDVYQQFLHPRSDTNPIVTSLVVSIDGEDVSVGGPGAHLEDYEARSVTLYRDE